MQLRRKVKADTTNAVRAVEQLHGLLLTLPHSVSVSIPVHHRTLRSRLRAAWSAFNR